MQRLQMASLGDRLDLVIQRRTLLLVEVSVFSRRGDDVVAFLLAGFRRVS